MRDDESKNDATMAEKDKKTLLEKVHNNYFSLPDSVETRVKGEDCCMDLD